EAAADADLAAIAAALAGELGAREVTLATDGLSALLGALGARDGVVVAAGTGTACLGRRGDRFARADGWGSLLGDAGSGFWIGRAGLDAALRELDGRDGGSPALAAAAAARFGPLERLADTVYRAEVPTRAVASFSRDVAATAASGDARAGAILAEAGRELAVTAAAVLGRLVPGDEPALVSYTGNVFAAGAPLLGALETELTARRPGARLLAPEADGLRGAAVLAGLAPSLTPTPGVLWRQP
ncbi:MAG TPA: BadF/BadG/BcrA/BcrD ATPase family protein, partial [Capillimicrobium sp.]